MRERILNTEVEFDGINYLWASMYILLNVDYTQLICEGLQDIVPKKRATRGSPPTVRTVSKDEHLRWKWLEPVDKYTPQDKRRLLA